MGSLAAALATPAARGSRRAERLLLPGTFITSLGNSIQLTAAAIVMVQAERSTLSVGWLFVAFSVPATLLSLVFGRLADRFDRRTLCMVCDGLSALVALALPVWLLLGLPPNAGIYAATFGLATVGAMFVPASSALIKERVLDHRLGPFNANFEMATQAGTLMSTAIGGVLVQLYGAVPLFFFNAATFAASLACFAAMGRRHAAAPGAEAHAVAAASGPARGPLVRLGLLYALGSPIITVSNTLIVVLVLEAFRQKAGVLGVVDALAGAGALAAAMAYKWASRRAPDLRIALVGYLACAAIIALEPQLGVAGLMVLLPLGALTFCIARIAARTLLLHAVPEHRAGAVFGTTNAFGLAASVAATVAISGIADRSRVGYGFASLALLVAVTAVVAVALLWRGYGRAAEPAALAGSP